MSFCDPTGTIRHRGMWNLHRLKNSPAPTLTLNAGKIQTEKNQLSVGGQTSDFKGLATGTLAGFVDVDYS